MRVSYISVVYALLTTAISIAMIAMTSGVKYVRFSRHQGSRCVPTQYTSCRDTQTLRPGYALA